MNAVRLWICVTTAALSLMPRGAEAGTIYSNLGPGDSFKSFEPGVGIGKTPAPVFTYAGVGFTLRGRNFVLSTIEVPIHLISGPNELDVFLMGDVAGLPSGMIESIHVRNGLPAGRPALMTISSATRPLLLAGRQYWLIAAGGSATTFAMWSFNALNERGPSVTGSGLGAMVRNDINIRLAFRVSENTITGLAPSSVMAGGPRFTLTVNGSNFGSNLPVLWNGIPLATTFVSSTQLRAVVPADLIARSGTATIAAGDTGTATFVVTPAPQPSLTSLSPSSAAAGGPRLQLTIVGGNFVGWSRVRWNTTELETTLVSATQLVASVPASLLSSAGTVSVTVANSGEAVSNALAFTVSCSYLIAASGTSVPVGGATSAVIPAAGGTGSVSVSTSAGCSWTAASSAAWVTIPLGAAGAGSGTVTYAVAANGGPARTAALTIAGQKFTINQLAAQPAIAAQGGVVSAASFKPGLASGAWVAVFGTNLSTTTRTWTASDFAGDQLPVRLDGVGVNIHGKPAYVHYISPTQVNVLAPEDSVEGPVQVEVINILGRSNAVTVQKLAVAPAWFTVLAQSRRYLAAVFPDGTLVGRPELFPGVAARPAMPGDTIALYVTGLGPTEPPYPDGRVIQQAAVLKNPISIHIAGVAVMADFAGIVGAGLYQINLQVPDLPDGDAVVSVQVGGFEPQDEAYLPIRK